LLEPDAVKVARPVLRGPGRSNALGLPDKASPVPSVVLDPVRESLISSSGALLLREAIRVAGLDRGLPSALAPWRSGRAVHDPGKMLLDVATAVALGGDCLADLAAVRAQPGLFGQVASDPTISRLFATLGGDVDAAVAAIRQARAEARARVWARRRPFAGRCGLREGGQVIVDIDATLVTAHSDKEHAEPTYKRGYGFHPMCSAIDHGAHGTGDTGVINLRPGRASAWDSADHIACLNDTLNQLPDAERSHVLVRADTGACSKAFLHHITDPPGWSTPSDPLPGTGCRPRSRLSPSRPGEPLSMAMASPATAPRSLSSPRGYRPRPSRPNPQPGSAPRNGRTECGSSPVVNDPTPARSSG
jgi:hypothetical protein